MATQLQLRRDTAADLASATPVIGEAGYDITNKNLLIGDGSRSGGVPHTSYAHDQSQRFRYASAVGGTVDVITLALNEDLDAYAEGVAIEFRASGANTGAVTINVSGLGARDLRKYSNGSEADLEADDISSGQIIRAVYDGTNFQIGSGGGGGGIISTITVTNSSTLNIPLPTGYNSLKITGWIVPISDGQDLRLRISDDDGSSYETSSYTYAVQSNDGSLDSYFASSGDDRINITSNNSGYGVGNASGESLQVEILISNYNNGSKFTLINGSGCYTGTGGSVVLYQFSGARQVASVVTNIQLLMGSGNITGTLNITSA